MKSFFGALLVFLFATAAFAQFANNPALTKKPPGAEAVKPADNGAGIPANADDTAIAKPAVGQPAGGGAVAAGPSAIFAALDTDGDGTISKVELRNAIKSLKKLDADNDGTLTAAECGGGAAAAGGGAAIAGNDPNNWVDRIMAK